MNRPMNQVVDRLACSGQDAVWIYFVGATGYAIAFGRAPTL